MPGPGINGRFGAAACGILDTFVAHDAGAGFKLPHLAREAGSQLKTADHPADDSRRHALAAPPALLLIPGSCAATDRRYERKGARMSAIRGSDRCDVFPVHGRPRLPSFQFVMGSEVSIAPVHPDFRCGRAAVPDGICWSDPNCFLALEVPQTFWALPTTV